jgi:predicted enzyme related to lactoylglutathione lyase
MSGARLTSVLLLVRDVSRALRLYASTVTLARFALGGGASLDVRVAANEAQCSTGYAPLLSFTVADMDAVVPRLLSHGAALDGAVRYNDYGRTAAVRTPDGHMLGLYEPTGLPEGGDNALAAAAAARARLKQGEGRGVAGEAAGGGGEGRDRR